MYHVKFTIWLSRFNSLLWKSNKFMDNLFILCYDDSIHRRYNRITGYNFNFFVLFQLNRTSHWLLQRGNLPYLTCMVRCDTMKVDGTISEKLFKKDEKDPNLFCASTVWWVSFVWMRRLYWFIESKVVHLFGRKETWTGKMPACKRRVGTQLL